MPNSTVSWTSLSIARTGQVWLVTHSLAFGTKWSWISERVAREFECDADDLDTMEDDDGREFVTLHGEPLVEIHNCYLRGNVAGLVRVDADVSMAAARAFDREDA